MYRSGGESCLCRLAGSWWYCSWYRSSLEGSEAAATGGTGSGSGTVGGALEVV